MAYQGLSYELAAVMPEANNTGLFTALVTFQQPNGTYGASGAPSGTFQDVFDVVGPGYIITYKNLPCVAAPTSLARIQATEAKELEKILALRFVHLLINAFVPGIIQGWRANVSFPLNAEETGTEGTIPFEVLGSEADSQLQMTRCEVRKVFI